MPRKSAKQALAGVVCCVEAKNTDGSDASKETENVLRGMGAQVENGGIRMGLTHMIWSNGNMKMVKAAEFMDIVVVSPLWVEQCRESAKLVPVDDFIVSPDTLTDATLTKTMKKPVPVLPVPVANVANEFADPGEFSSSQRILAKSNEEKPKSSRGVKSGIIRKTAVERKLVDNGKSSYTKVKNDRTSNRDKENEDNSTITSKRTSKKGKEAVLSSSSATTTSSNSRKKNKVPDSSSTAEADDDQDYGPSTKSKSKAKKSSVGSSPKLKVTEKAEKTSKVSKTSAKRRIKSSEDDSDDDNTINGLLDCKNTKNQTSKKWNSIAITGSNSSALPKDEHPALKKKKVDMEKKKPVPKKSSDNSKVKKATKADSCGNAVVLSLSGFSGEERSLLEDVVSSLITQNCQRGGGKNKTKSKAKKADTNVQVSLQQPDPQIELPLIKAMMSSTHVVVPDESVHSNRTLRILFAMARKIPVLTPAWVYASLDRGGEWLLAPADYHNFLHPRFNMRSPEVKNDAIISVFVGPCKDPSKRVMEALVDSCDVTSRTSSINSAELVVMDEPSKNYSSLLSKYKNFSDHISKLQREGRFISCKEFFDCIELNNFPAESKSPMAPHKTTSSALKSKNDDQAKSKSKNKNIPKKKSKPVPHVAELDDDEEEEEFTLLPPRKKIPSKRCSNKKGGNTPSTGGSSDGAVDYTDCLVTSQVSPSSFISDSMSSNKKKRARESDVTLLDSAKSSRRDSNASSDVTLVDSPASPSSSASELSFPLGTVPDTPTRSAQGGNKKSRQLLDVQDEDEVEVVGNTADSSYLSGEGSPCW